MGRLLLSPKPKTKTRGEHTFLRPLCFHFHIDIHQPQATPSTPNTPYRTRQSERDDDGKRRVRRRRGCVVGGRGRQHAHRFFSKACQRGSLVALGTQEALTRGLVHVHGARHKEERHVYVGLQSQRRDEGTCCVCVGKKAWRETRRGTKSAGFLSGLPTLPWRLGSLFYCMQTLRLTPRTAVYVLLLLVFLFLKLTHPSIPLLTRR